MSEFKPNTDSVVSPLPSMASLCLEIPLYTPIHLEKEHNKALNEIYWFRGQFDGYCLDCRSETVFHSTNSRWQREDNIINSKQIIYSRLHCTRNKEHELFFVFQIRDRTLTKIGQYPSAADLSKPEFRKYRSVLTNQQFNELNKGVGLTAHGVGIGAFVYLRRIFENLIEEAHDRVSSRKDWDEDVYARSRMTERIKLLENELPDFLVENRSLYSILSKGIHDLNENECLEAFPIILMGIELVLDELIIAEEKERKLKEASQLIGKLKHDLKEGSKDK